MTAKAAAAANREANRLVDQALELQYQGRYEESEALLTEADALLDSVAQ